MSCCRGLLLRIYNSIPLLNPSKKNRQRRGVLPRPVYVYIYIGFNRFRHFEYYMVLLLLECVTLFLRCRTSKLIKTDQKLRQPDQKPSICDQKQRILTRRGGVRGVARYAEMSPGSHSCRSTQVPTIPHLYREQINPLHAHRESKTE